MCKQTNKHFELISVDRSSNKFKINGIDVSLVPDAIKMSKVKSIIFLRALLCLLLVKM